LSAYKGKVALIVNVASLCGFTPQYEAMEQLHEKFKDKGLAVLGFPANEFGAQGPGSDADIKNFCRTKYSVNFDLFSKIREQETNKDALVWLNLCHEEMRAGREAYLQKDNRTDGARFLREAKRYLSDARGRKSHTPDFVAGPQGEVRKNPLKGPEQADTN
jgi:glutathione peroxidase-family protein